MNEKATSVESVCNKSSIRRLFRKFLPEPGRRIVLRSHLLRESQRARNEIVNFEVRKSFDRSSFERRGERSRGNEN